jgi:vacuolar-type H+-ATPase subunit C/Vma6
MTLAIQTGLDFIAAFLRGRRGRFAEAGRLDALCRIRSVRELVRVLYPESAPLSAVDFQRRMVQEMADELAHFFGTLDAASDALFDWQRRRFMVENLKVLARAFLNRLSWPEVRGHLVVLPPDLHLDAPALLSEESMEAFAARVPDPVLREGLLSIREPLRDLPTPFFPESALDAAYFRELIARSERLTDEDRALVLRLVRQEADQFLLRLAARGRFLHGLDVTTLAQWHVEGAGIGAGRFASMLAATDLHSAASFAVGYAVDALPAPVSAASVERQAWNRWWLLANGAFRRSATGLAAAVGYLVLRRIERANLITLTEGIRLGMEPGVLRARLIPFANPEAVHV